ncbi:head GIN domain-containing protein [Flavobacterium subsaxonicum]|uniref:Putative auto-transporter adhesin head GIN domain-containing protein n=1 Tax=Flavobacterium subsaxonicum WB 4.1-42 = DSM 21790 TaxID=1121898 RepID=A0A0A2MLI3_9FLAO|nr:head GIN domain-containing protein [Flavobacterium subsaxonicum]KGO92451.1 hypothetical protein Q766_13420 [Flavobacterium subsaxonicum WB 4.1-42 = DSM 21790]
MIKVIVHIAQAIIAVVVALLFSSCNMETVDGSGNVTKQTRTVSGEFTSVTASSGLDVYIEQGVNRSVVVEADDNLQQHIKVEASGTELKITSDVNIGNSESKKITVVLPEITGIEANSGSGVKGKTVLKTDKVKLNANSAGVLEVTVIAKDVVCETSSSGTVKLLGSTENLDAEASSGSTLNAGELKTINADAEASSGASLIVNPTEKLAADASSGSSIRYLTTPVKKISTTSDSGGSVSKQ